MTISAEENWAAIERITGRGSWVWDISDGTVTWTDQLYRVFGFEPGEVEPSYEGYIGRIHPDDRESVQQRIARSLEKRQCWEDTKRARKGDGTEFLLATQGDVICDDDGNPTHMFGVCGDVTSAVEGQKARAELDALVESSHDAIVVQDLKGRITAWSPGACRVFGFSTEEVMGREPEEFLDPADYRDTRTVIERILAGESKGAIHEGFRSRADGTRFRTSTITSPVTGEGGVLTGTACIIRDVSERERGLARQQPEIEDPVTGLIHRKVFMERLREALPQTGGALVRFDIDNFRLINDRYGYEAADGFLRSLARALSSTASPGDELTRLGDDEFALFMPGKRESELPDIGRLTLERIRSHVEPLDGTPVTATASIGLAHAAGPSGKTCDRLLAEADRALFEAKSHGKDRCVIASAQDLPSSADRFDWGDRLRTALAEDRLEIHLQPIVSVADRSVVMYEVLVRKRSRNGQLVPPGEFLGIAEDVGLVHEVDRTVVRKSLELLEQYESLRLMVNLSGKSLDDEALFDMLRARLIGGAIGPGRLTFELTETSAIVDVDAAQRFSLELRELGCDLALDDFGTGFGSFAYLKQVAATYLKIDGEFVASPRSKTDDVVIDSVVSLARALDKITVAEHVEDEETFERVAQAGADLAQGFHFGRPAPVEEVLGSSRA